MFNCSQTKFVAIILVLLVFMQFVAWKIFHLTLLTIRPQRRYKQVTAIVH